MLIEHQGRRVPAITDEQLTFDEYDLGHRLLGVPYESWSMPQATRFCQWLSFHRFDDDPDKPFLPWEQLGKMRPFTVILEEGDEGYVADDEDDEAGEDGDPPAGAGDSPAASAATSAPTSSSG